MLIQRVLTAVVLLPLLLAAIWWLPTPRLYAVFAMVCTGAAWEWSGLMRLPSIARRAAYTMLVAALLAAAWWLRGLWWILALAGLLWWIYAVGLLRGYPANLQRQPMPVAVVGIVGIASIVPAPLMLARLHEAPEGALRLLYLFFLIFCADTGAYFVGRRFGRRKLLPAVSPGKTVEGLLGGLAACAVWALAAGLPIFHASGAQAVAVIAISLGVALISVVGDLSESLFKRVAGVKDSGKLLPGHGGLLDRIDSLIAAAPLMVLCITWAKL